MHFIFPSVDKDFHEIKHLFIFCVFCAIFDIPLMESWDYAYTDEYILIIIIIISTRQEIYLQHYHKASHHLAYQYILSSHTTLTSICNNPTSSFSSITPYITIPCDSSTFKYCANFYNVHELISQFKKASARLKCLITTCWI